VNPFGVAEGLYLGIAADISAGNVAVIGAHYGKGLVASAGRKYISDPII
jgi:hypothetical protein